MSLHDYLISPWHMRRWELGCGWDVTAQASGSTDGQMGGRVSRMHECVLHQPFPSELCVFCLLRGVGVVVEMTLLFRSTSLSISRE